jgi:enoyl-CoA hydratase/carnithine racemase
MFGMGFEKVHAARRTLLAFQDANGGQLPGLHSAADAERCATEFAPKVFPEGELLSSVAAIAREMAAFDRMTLVETKRLSNEVLHQSLDGSMRMQEWLFRTYIGAEDNHRRIDALQAQLAAARAKKG